MGRKGEERGMRRRRGEKGREGKDRRGWGDAEKAEYKRRVEKGDENLTYKTLGERTEDRGWEEGGWREMGEEKG